MKTHCLLSTLLVLSFALAGCSHSSRSGHTHNYRSEKTFTEFIGLEIRNRQNEKLGTIRQITVDLENARVVEVIANAARLGGGSTSVAPRALILDSKNNVMWLDMSRERFAAAPRVNPADITGDFQRDRIAAMNRYYGLEPWFYMSGQQQHSNAETLRLGHVRRSDQVTDLPLVNKQGTYLGRISTLHMDIAKGQVVHVVVDRGGFMENLSIVQARALTFNAERNGLVLDDSQTQLGAAPRFRWTDIGGNSYQEEQFVNRTANMKQGESFRDRQKTTLIQSRIQSASGLSSSARQVQVATLNAQTTLRGSVASESEKVQIGQIAMQSGRRENVSNLIEVRSPRR